MSLQPIAPISDMLHEHDVEVPHAWLKQMYCYALHVILLFSILKAVCAKLIYVQSSAVWGTGSVAWCGTHPVELKGMLRRFNYLRVHQQCAYEETLPFTPATTAGLHQGQMSSSLACHTSSRSCLIHMERMQGWDELTRALLHAVPTHSIRRLL